MNKCNLSNLTEEDFNELGIDNIIDLDIYGEEDLGTDIINKYYGGFINLYDPVHIDTLLQHHSVADILSLLKCLSFTGFMTLGSSIYHCKDGLLHNDKGAAIEGPVTYYFEHGVLHREDGPAIIWADKLSESYYINGKFVGSYRPNKIIGGVYDDLGKNSTR